MHENVSYEIKKKNFKINFSHDLKLIGVKTKITSLEHV